MKKPNWPARVVWRYALFQIPSIGILILILILVQRWIDLPTWFSWGSIAIWIAKDIILFPFVWRSYDRSIDICSLVGTKGIVEKRLVPSGYIRVHGELWQAEVMRKGNSIEKGEKVLVRGISGLTLLVEPAQKENNGQRSRISIK